jgi:glucose-1-phosphate adenylyltransferase
MAAKCIAMILAGGSGERLGSLTHHNSKPAVHFGGNMRIIDFTLNNCIKSGIQTVGILSQHYSEELHDYIDSTYNSNIFRMLPSNLTGNFYEGTADAVRKNISYIDRLDPEYVLILAGDHIYDMDYQSMLDFHIKNKADVTVASNPVPIEKASNFGIIIADKTGRITDFKEKPYLPKSNLASMGIYVFTWDVLKEVLVADHEDVESRHDFGRNILPAMLNAGERMYTFEFDGYWRDVGTVESFWAANMELLDKKAPSEHSKISESYTGDDSNLISDRAVTYHSVMHGRCAIFGKVIHSILGHSVQVRNESEVIDSIVMPGAFIGNNVVIHKAIIGANAVIGDNTVIGVESGSGFFVESKLCTGGISLIEPGLHIPENMNFQGGSHINTDMLREWRAHSDMAARTDFHPMLWKELSKEREGSDYER